MGYIQNINRVEAISSMNMMTAVAIGSGTMKKEEARRITDKWHRELDGGQPRRRKPQKMTFDMIQQLGIPIQKKK